MEKCELKIDGIHEVDGPFEIEMKFNSIKDACDTYARLFRDDGRYKKVWLCNENGEAYQCLKSDNPGRN